ncbi:MAG: hypothetical protein JRC60_07920 [Deltaproteobacteria bacterium]|nr:hypothetical protein [Deltaproteobacteria bacterium]
MNFKCPYCGKECNFMEVQAEGDLYAIIKLVPVFGKHSNLVWAYVELFGISPLKAKTKKLLLLLEEMARLFQAEGFSYRKKIYRISRAGIAEALNITVHRDFPDRLTNHNYLKKIMISIAEKEDHAAGKQAEKDLRKEEDKLRSGGRISETQRRTNLRKLGDIIKTIS